MKLRRRHVIILTVVLVFLAVLVVSNVADARRRHLAELRQAQASASFCVDGTLYTQSCCYTSGGFFITKNRFKLLLTGSPAASSASVQNIVWNPLPEDWTVLPENDSLMWSSLLNRYVYSSGRRLYSCDVYGKNRELLWTAPSGNYIDIENGIFSSESVLLLSYGHQSTSNLVRTGTAVYHLDTGEAESLSGLNASLCLDVLCENANRLYCSYGTLDGSKSVVALLDIRDGGTLTTLAELKCSSWPEQGALCTEGLLFLNRGRLFIISAEEPGETVEVIPEDVPEEIQWQSLTAVENMIILTGTEGDKLFAYVRYTDDNALELLSEWEISNENGLFRNTTVTDGICAVTYTDAVYTVPVV